MRWLPFFSLALLIVIGPVADGQASGYPNCTEQELLVTLDSILDHSIAVILDASPMYSMDDLVNFAADRLDSRESRIVPVPLCAQAISLMRHDFLAEDTLGKMALSEIEMPDDANPYLLRLPSSEERRQQHLREVSGVETSTAPAPAVRDLPVCSTRQNFKLESLATNFLVMLSAASAEDGADRWIEALDQVLLWRVENLSTVPDCLEAIELSLLLTKAATDAAALFAFRHAGVADEQNPYVTTVDEARAWLPNWRQDITLTRPENKGKSPLFVGPASELPPCYLVEVAYVFSTFLDDVQDVIEISQELDSPALMIDYAEAHIDLRSGTLSRFPPCAELFEIGWLAQEYLDANGGYASHHIFGFSPQRNPFAAQLVDASAAFLDWSEMAAARLRDIDGMKGPAPDEPVVAACRPGEIAYMIGYLIPDFRSFVRAGLAIESSADNLALIERSFTLRERLWSRLPRCRQALEIGLLMRKVAGDWLSMQAAHNILSRDDNRYAAQVQAGLDLFLELSDAFMDAATGESQSAAPPQPLIPSERNTGLPACAGADQVEALTHLIKPVQALYGSMPEVEDVQDLLAFAQSGLQMREDKMPLVKLCAENFDYVWRNIQAMNDIVSWFSMFFDGISRSDIPVTDYNAGELERIIAWHERVLEIARSDEWDKDENSKISNLPTCSNADLVFLVSRIFPQFQSFYDSAAAVESKAEYHALVDELIDYRDKLKAGLPRCVDALEIGLAMVKTASDFAAMYALDYAGLAADDNPYSEQIDRYVAWIRLQNSDLVDMVAVDDLNSDNEPTMTYYATGKPYTNLRACASTSCDIVATAQPGEALTVLDDSSDWYELRLADGTTAYIAGFLASQTPPAR